MADRTGRLRYFSRETLISLRRNLLMTLAGVLTVAVSLFLLGVMLLISRAVDAGTERWAGGVEFEIFMRVDATEAQIKEVRTALEDSPEVESFDFLDQEEALQEFERIFADDPNLIENVRAQDLPSSFRVAPTDPEVTEQIVVRFEGRNGVDEIVTAQEQIDKILTATRWLRTMIIGLTVLLLLASLFLIVNTIRLATFARRREIEVMKLVGASNWFIRIPFMAEGLIQGAVGAGLAFGGVYLVQSLVFGRVLSRQEGNLLEGFYATSSDAIQIGIICLVIGAGIGVLGSFLGLRRYLKT